MPAHEILKPSLVTLHFVPELKAVSLKCIVRSEIDCGRARLWASLPRVLDLESVMLLVER